MNWLKKKFKDKQLLVQKNQQANHHFKINRLVPRIPRSFLNHMIDWLVTVMLWCRNVKPTGYRGWYIYITEVNDLFRWKRIFDAVFSMYFQLFMILSVNNIFQKHLKKHNTITDSGSRSINYLCIQINNMITTVRPTSWYLRLHIHG